MKFLLLETLIKADRKLVCYRKVAAVVACTILTFANANSVRADEVSGLKLNVSRQAETPLDLSLHARPESIVTCSEVQVRVSGATLEEQRFACSAATDVLHRLGRCGMSLRRTLDIEISKVVLSPFGDTIFGRFDIKQDIVFVTQFANVPALVEGTPYSGFSHADFYRSLIVHEAVHGVMHQNYKRPPISRAANEYPAYALQIASLPADLRDQFLRSFEGRLDRDNLRFNDMILGFDPYYFAAQAYEHFAQSSGGCSRLLSLLEGDVDFVALTLR